MTSPSEPKILFHELFREHNTDPKELLACTRAFLDGDCGIISDENKVLGFMSRSLDGKFRHGAYRIKTAGLIHVVGTETQINVLPDIVFSDITRDCECSPNPCTCLLDKYEMEVQN